jgi:hypothetical protein
VKIYAPKIKKPAYLLRKSPNIPYIFIGCSHLFETWHPYFVAKIKGIELEIKIMRGKLRTRDKNPANLLHKRANIPHIYISDAPTYLKRRTYVS